MTIDSLPRLNRPALVNAAEYWLSPTSFLRRCGRLGDRFLVPMPATGAWLGLSAPDDLKAVFGAPTDVLRLGAALRKVAPHELILGPTGMTSLDGEAHRRTRNLQLPPFQVRSLAAYEPAMRAATESVLASWPQGRPVSSQQPMQLLTLEVILATVFGVTDPGRLQQLRAATLEFVEIVASTRFTVQTMVATARRGGWDRPFPQVRASMTRVDAIVLDEVRERRTHGTPGDDMLSLFVAARDDAGLPMGDDEICDAVRTLLVAGHDTTASTLAWTLEMVGHHAEVLSRLQTAVDEGDDAYVDAVIKEVMRMRPVVPVTVRVAAEPFQLGDLEIPAGTMIAAFIALTHERPDLYDAPEEFRPERFLDHRPGPYDWIPFGGGQRRCLGAAFSLLEARVVLTTMLARHQIVPATRSAERIGRKNVTLVPARGGRVTLVPRG